MEILVIDDNREICELIRNILLAEDYLVQSCCTPEEFEDALRDDKPQLIITDMLMSGFDGRTLAKSIKANPNTSHIKIMLMSAHPDAANFCETTRVDAFLAKPFEIDDLVEKVDQLLRTS